jgi:type VI secretion system protein ImpJ
MTEPRKPVFWYQGLFLQPQHFQQADLFHQSSIAPLRDYIQPFFYGTCGYTIDEGALREMVFTLSDGEFLFQDGTWVKTTENAKLEARPFKDAWTNMDKPFKVFIGLRRWDHAGKNVVVPGGSDARRRYLADEAAAMKDVYGGDNIAEVKLLDHLLRFFWEDEISDAADYHLIPLAILTFNGQDVVLSRDFTPPAVTLAASEPLLKIMRGVRELILSRCRILEEYKNPRGFQKADLQAAYLNFFLALHTLNRYIPLFEHFTEVSTVHPFTAYGMLRQCAGELSSFTDRVDALGRLSNGTELIPPYDHENLVFCFRQVQLLIEEIVASMILGMENIIHFDRDTHYFRAQLPQELLDNRNLFYLVVKSAGKAGEDILDMVRHIVKLGPEEEVPVLITRALPGIPLEQKLEMPPGLPRKPGMLCFEIDRTNRYWHDVLKNGRITLYWPDAPEDTIVELAILKP